MTNSLNSRLNAAVTAASTTSARGNTLNAFTGSNIPTFALPEAADPIVLACELSELARILGGEFTPRPPNFAHTIFLL